MTPDYANVAREIAGECDCPAYTLNRGASEIAICGSCKMKARIAAALLDADAKGYARGVEDAAKVAGQHVCRLDGLPCVGKAREGDQCGCITANSIARQIRALVPPDAGGVVDDQGKRKGGAGGP